MGLQPSFNDERLNPLLIKVVNDLQKRTVTGQNDTFGIGAKPMVNGELGVLSLCSSMSYKDSILLCTQLVIQHLGIFVADGQLLEMVINKAVGCLCPFQDDVRAVLGVIREETTVQPLAFLFQYPHCHLDTSLSDALNTPALHFGKGVDTAHDNTLHTLLDNQVGTRRCFPVMGTRLQRNVDGSLSQQWFVLGFYRCKGIHLGMSLATAHMIAFTNNPFPILRGGKGEGYHCPHHRVRPCSLYAVCCQLQTASHVFLVVHHTLFLFFATKVHRISQTTKHLKQKSG